MSSGHKVEITTITVCTNLNSRLDLDLLIKFFKAFHPRYEIKYTKNNRRSKSNKMFFNSFCFQMRVLVDSVKNKVNVKIFKSGAVQITGCKNLKAVRIIPKMVYNLICDCIPAIQDCETFSLSNPRIVMLNAMFRLGKKLNRQFLFDHLISIGEHDIRFDPEKYHGIILKHKGVSFFVFYTGVVIMTSNGDDLKKYKESYRSFLRIIKDIPPNSNVFS